MNLDELLSRWTPTVDDAFIKDGACRGLDANLFMPTVGQTCRDVLEICNGRPATYNDPGTPPCPVKEQCLEYALSIPRQTVGIWGGTSERERRRIRQERAKAVKTPDDPNVRPALRELMELVSAVHAASRNTK